MSELEIGYASPPLTESPEAEDEFYYGHRLVKTYDESGEEVWTYQPLTLEDFLDPQEGDHFVQGTLHDDDVEKAKSIFRYLYRDNPTVAVFSDLKMVWDIEGLSQPAPDVAVIPDVEDPDKPRRAFDVAVEGTRPYFVLEIVSPRYRKPDREEKVDIYAQAGVDEYVIIDPWLDEEDNVAYEVLGYRLHDGRYTEIEPDERGWIYSATNGVWIGPTKQHDTFLVVDAESNERILPAEERAVMEATARIEAEERAVMEATARIEAEERAEALEAELVRLREELARNE